MRPSPWYVLVVSARNTCIEGKFLFLAEPGCPHGIRFVHDSTTEALVPIKIEKGEQVRPDALALGARSAIAGKEQLTEHQY